MCRVFLFFSLLLTLTAMPLRAATIATSWPEEPPAGTFYLLMIKGKSELTVRSLSDPGKIYKTFRAISGLNPGDKMATGDKRTPEGIYFIQRRISKSEMTSEHGVMAFGLNYPNKVDRYDQRGGYGIWIHGVDNDARVNKVFDTRGCIAMANGDMSDLGSRLKVGVPVIIVNNESQAQMAGLEAPSGAYANRVREWARAWSSRDPSAYIAFYHPDFRARGMDYTAWLAYKRRLTQTYKNIDVKLSEVRVLRHYKYALVAFRQDYRSDRFQSDSYKQMYLVGEPENARIIFEDVLQEWNAGPVEAPALASPRSPATDDVGQLNF